METEQFRRVAPAVQPVPFVNLPPMEVETLSGGTVLNVYNSGSDPINSLNVITAGGRCEGSTDALAQLSVALSGEGTKRFTSADIADRFDFCGSWVSNVAMSHFTSHRVFSLNSQFGKVLPYFHSMIAEPVFPEEAFERERLKMIKNMELNRKSVLWNAEACGNRLIMGENHPLARVATTEEVAKLTVEQIREFNNLLNHPGNRHIYLAGQITDEVRRLVREAFSCDCCELKPTVLNMNSFNPAPAGTEEFVEVGGAVQNAVCLLLPAIPRSHPDYIPLHIAVTALGGYFGSRLNQNIREEKGLTYGINAMLLGQLDGAYVEIAAQCDSSSTRLLIDEVMKEMVNLAENPPQGDELQRLCQSAVGSQFDTVSTPLSICDFHCTELTVGCPAGYFDAKSRALQSLVPEYIAAVARKYLRPEAVRIAVAGKKV